MKTPSAGLLLVALCCVLAVSGQTFHALQAQSSFVELLVRTLPTLGGAVLLCSTFAMLERLNRPWVRRTTQVILINASWAAALMTLIAAIGFWQTGSIPRIQQLHGLTWDMVGPSIMQIARNHAAVLLLSLMSLLGVLMLLRIGLRHASLAPLRAPHLAMVGAVVLTTSLWAAHQQTSQAEPFIATQLFYTDLDTKSALSEKALQKESRFFKTYYRNLAETEGSRYPDIHTQLRGSNVIWVVLESVRAKDLPIYGGTADMPNFMKAREHMVLLEHLYAQDPRSTKAFTQMDLGRFSLLSWDTYSNNIPWMFPEDGLAKHLDKLDYSTIALVNSDANYDNNQLFQQRHGYKKTMYRQELNPGSANSDDLKLLEHVNSVVGASRRPFYMMVWPVQTHHPYGRKYWTQAHKHQDDNKHSGSADYPRYLSALREADDWFGRLLDILKAQGLDESTTIVVTGDHGEAFGEHEPGNVFHGNGVYEESVHIAGFIYNPKIKGLQRESRNIRLLDIPATILDIASGKDYVFNDGRSIFRNYRYEMPIYLFSSWAGAIGIIQDGYKLWRRVKQPQDVFFASMQEIRENPSKERQRLKNGQGEAQLQMLNDWETAMMARSARLLTQDAAQPPPLNDVIRVYCDNGSGFSEERKGVASFAGFSGKVVVPMNSDCRALRIAPLRNTTVPENAYLDLDIADLQVLGHDRSWMLGDLEPVSSNAMEIINQHELRITSDSSFIDYRLDSRNHGIKQIAMDVTYVWGHRLVGPPGAPRPTAKATP